MTIGEFVRNKPVRERATPITVYDPGDFVLVTAVRESIAGEAAPPEAHGYQEGGTYEVRETSGGDGEGDGALYSSCNNSQGQRMGWIHPGHMALTERPVTWGERTNKYRLRVNLNDSEVPIEVGQQVVYIGAPNGDGDTAGSRRSEHEIGRVYEVHSIHTDGLGFRVVSDGIRGSLWLDIRCYAHAGQQMQLRTATTRLMTRRPSRRTFWYGGEKYAWIGEGGPHTHECLHLREGMESRPVIFVNTTQVEILPPDQS
jgi:hypothetical protein